MHRPSISISLLLALAVAGPLAAQDTPAGGTVTESGRPVAGATVTVDGASALVTDQDGKYGASYAAGDHTFKIALHGYQPIEQKVTITKDQAMVVDFALDPVLQLTLTAPASLKQGEAGKAQLAVKNAGTSDYSIDAASLRFVGSDGKDRSADIKVEADAANPTSVKAGQTATLAFNVTPADAAAPGKVTVRASLFAFDSALGKNILENGSFEAGDDTTADSWSFGGDNTGLATDFTGLIATDTAVTGARSVQIQVPSADAGDLRFYWSQNAVPLKPGTNYVLSGYVKTQDVAMADSAWGAAVYIPIVHNDPYQQPPAPYITGTRDWRKDIVSFRTSDATDNGDDHMTSYIRGELQQASGTTWFDNLSLTEGGDDGSLTVTGADQTLEVTPK